MAQIPVDIKSMRTGVLRQDIELIPPGKHGSFPMIFDPAAESYYKLTFSAYQMLKHCTRDRSVEEFCRHLSRAGYPAEPEEVLLLKQFLIQNNLLVPEPGQFAEKLANHRKSKGKYIWLKLASAYLYFKLPPLHPQPLIDKLKPYLRFLGNPVFFWILAIPALLGYFLAFRDFSTVLATFKATFSWAGLVKYFFAVILLKIVHESGHLAGNIHFNCRVRAIGISVIFLYPRFFSDTTDSWRLAPNQRLLIDAGGLLAEVICGGIAALLWCYLPPGNFQSTMFFIFSTSTISTLLVNGNPLIRFDGYYILCDLLKVENLMSRSTNFLKMLNRRLLFGVGAWPQEDRPWLMAGFGIAAFIYRFLLYTSIILVIYNTMIKTFAVILLVLEVFTIFIFPFYNEARAVHLLSRRAGRRADLIFLLVVIFSSALILFLPLSWRSRLPGIIRSRTSLLVSTLETGYLASPLTNQEVEVKKDQVILQLVSPQLDFQREKLQQQLRENMILLNQQLGESSTAGDAVLTRQRIRSIRAVLGELDRRKANLSVRAGTGGVFQPAAGQLSAGAVLPAGTVLGSVESGERIVTAYAYDDQLRRLKPGMQVKMRFADSSRDFKGVIDSINPIPVTLQLSPLLKICGGEISAVPVVGKFNEFAPEHPLFAIDITPLEEIPFQQGRTLRVLVQNRELLFDQLWSQIIYFFRSEF